MIAKNNDSEEINQGKRKRRELFSTKKEEKKVELPEYNHMGIKGLYVLFLLSVISVSMDFGVYAAASLEIKADFNLSNLEFGTLQTMVFFGIFAGKIKIRI